MRTTRARRSIDGSTHGSRLPAAAYAWRPETLDKRRRAPDDVGFVMGRIHTSGKIPAAGLDVDIDWTVAGGDGHDYSENELEIWFSAQDKIGVSVRDPAGRTYGPVEPLEFIENQRLVDGTFISIYNDLYHAANGANYIGIFLSPNFKAQPLIGIAAGQWTVRLHGRDIRDGRFDGWIERDDPLPLPPDPETPRRWRFLLSFRSAATSIAPRFRRSRAATALSP